MHEEERMKGIGCIDRCPVCDGEFDVEEMACFNGSRGPSFNYCSCSRCRRAFEVGNLEFRGKAEWREVEYR